MTGVLGLAGIIYKQYQNPVVRIGFYLEQQASSCYGSIQQRLDEDQYVPLATEVYGLYQTIIGFSGLVVGTKGWVREANVGRKTYGLYSPTFALECSAALCKIGLKNMLRVPTVAALGFLAAHYFAAK